MKRRRVVWSRDALDDLISAADYISQDSANAARRVAAAIRRDAAVLGNAAIGRPGRVVGTYEKPLRGLPYILAYEIADLKGAEAIVILRVIHGARDWPEGGWPKDD